MKIKVLHRQQEVHQSTAASSSSNGGPPPLQRNPDPVLHPFAREREYKRAMNAVKMDKMFAKPLVQCLDKHFDSVRTLRRSNKHPTRFYSGSCDGEVVHWDLGWGEVVSRWNAHRGFVRGMVESTCGHFLFSCGDDKLIHQWSLDEMKAVEGLGAGGEEEEGALVRKVDKKIERDPLGTWRTTTMLTSRNFSKKSSGGDVAHDTTMLTSRNILSFFIKELCGEDRRRKKYFVGGEICL